MYEHNIEARNRLFVPPLSRQLGRPTQRTLRG
jgi:hypothetical protein